MKHLKYLIIFLFLAIPMSSASMGISYEDETGYTSMRGSFYDGQSWWGGEILTNDYTSDFSAGADNWVEQTSCVVTGNIDGISDGTISYDDVLRIVPDAEDNSHLARSGWTEVSATLGHLYKVRFKYYIPAANTEVDGFKLRNFNQKIIDLRSNQAIPAIVGSWTSVTVYYTVTSDASTYLRFDLCDGSDTSWNANGTDLFYIKDIIYDEATSLNTQSGIIEDGMLVIISDGTYTASGYLKTGQYTNETTSALANNVTAITKANPGVVSSTAHALHVGEQVYFSGLTEMTELNGTYKTVTILDSANTFSINDTSGYVAAETTGGACCVEVTAPAANAVQIYKERGLVNQGWFDKDAALNVNAEAAWDFDVHRTGRGAYNW